MLIERGEVKVLRWVLNVEVSIVAWDRRILVMMRTESTFFRAGIIAAGEDAGSLGVLLASMSIDFIIEGPVAKSDCDPRDF